MRITLRIENRELLPTGGQVEYACSDRGFDIGRHEHLDWSLPDPERVVSGKHCEVRFENGAFVLYDVSTNGTYLNGSQTRLDRPHVLRSGDRLLIGDYIIGVTVSAGAENPGEPPAPAASPAWDAPFDAPSYQAPAPQQPAPYRDIYEPPTSFMSPGSATASPWPTDTLGQEGRHAPPPADPGIGVTPDDIWTGGRHVPGTSDPGYYDAPSVNSSARSGPSNADLLDHYAHQPVLIDEPEPQQAPTQEPQPTSPFPPPDHPEAGAGEVTSPFPTSPDHQAEPDPFALSGWPPPEAAEEMAPAPTEATSSTPIPAAMSTEDHAAPPPKVRAAQQPVAAPAPSTPGCEPAPADDRDLIAAFAAGAGIDPSCLSDREAEAFMRELGQLLRGLTEDVMALLQARSEVKALTRSPNRTMISRSGNNALKFSPTAASALQTMLAKDVEESGYLPLGQALAAAFKDIQKHHVWTYAAMQKAAARFGDTLSPQALEQSTPASRSTFGNHKAKLWDLLCERWTAHSTTYDGGIAGLFTHYFTESYEELSAGNKTEP